jgi:hypothetical protein
VALFTKFTEPAFLQIAVGRSRFICSWTDASGPLQHPRVQKKTGLSRTRAARFE